MASEYEGGGSVELYDGGDTAVELLQDNGRVKRGGAGPDVEGRDLYLFT